MFMWASGARFENRLNHYENDPRFVHLQVILSHLGPVLESQKTLREQELFCSRDLFQRSVFRLEEAMLTLDCV